jgi:dTDP-4-dehydrorhamnose reductase
VVQVSHGEMFLHLIMKVSKHFKRCVCVADSSDAPSIANFMANAVQQAVLNDLVNLACVLFILFNARPMIM